MATQLYIENSLEYDIKRAKDKLNIRRIVLAKRAGDSKNECCSMT